MLPGNLGDAPAAHRRWQATRHTELAAPDSWLGLVGLVWLEQGDNLVGHGADCAVALPAGPSRLGSLRVAGEQISWLAEPGCAVRVARGGTVQGDRQLLLSDRDGAPSELSFGSLVLIVIERDGRLAVRLRDRNWAAGQTSPALTCYDYDPAWRIEAEW